MANLTTAERIFLLRYQLRLPAYLVESGISAKGHGRSNDPGVAKMEATQLTYVNWPVYRLAGLLEAEFTVNATTFVNIEDSLTMYTAIAEHISAWNKAINERMHKLNLPHDDLIVLDELASQLWPFARQQRASDIIDSVNDNEAVSYILRRTNQGSQVESRINNLKRDHSSTAIESLEDAVVRRGRSRKGSE